MNDGGGFSAYRLSQVLHSEFNLVEGDEIFVGFSGGLDSSVLLHALVHIEHINCERVTALHANHGLHKAADAWEQHCRDLCRSWGIQFFSTHLDFDNVAGQGTEASARKARYCWFQGQMNDGAVLMTAHHFDDQVETILANLFRGSGAHGIAGIKKSRPFGPGRLWRPLLDVDRGSITQYAGAQGLSWIEDPMNTDLSYTRNYLRHQILPLVENKWPGVARTIARAATNWRDTAELLDDVARSDLRGIPHRQEGLFHLLRAPELTSLSSPRSANVLRSWFVRCGFKPPPRDHLQYVLKALVNTVPKATSVRALPGAEVRRYRDWLYLSKPLRRQTVPSMVWDRNTTGTLLADNRLLVARPAVGEGIRKSVYDSESILVRPRYGGERCRLPGCPNHRKLKKLFQERGIPPWQRERIPLLYIGDSLAGVAGLWYCQPFAAEEGEPGMAFELVDSFEAGN